MAKIIIIGANGQLAFDLKKVFEIDHEVIGATRADFDITDGVSVSNFIKYHAPDIVINTAAYHKTEECELNPEKSFAVNAVGAYNAAKAAADINAKIVFFSTDYVFGGDKENFKESDAPNPLNVYGASKLAGEILTRTANKNYYIIRTSWLYGSHKSGKGNNFVSLMLEKAINGENIKVVDDQFGSPTYTRDLALKIKELIDKKAPSGIYHITNSGSCSWYEFARRIFEFSGVKADISAISSAERQSNMKRPKCSVLVSENLEKQGIEKLRPWQDALREFLVQYSR